MSPLHTRYVDLVQSRSHLGQLVQNTVPPGGTFGPTSLAVPIAQWKGDSPNSSEEKSPHGHPGSCIDGH